MTVTLLVSVSLLTLVSTARPILHSQNGAQLLSESSVKMGQAHALQAVLQSHFVDPSDSNSNSDLEAFTRRLRLANINTNDLHIVRIDNEEEEQAVLSALDAGDVRGVVRLGEGDEELVDVLWRVGENESESNSIGQQEQNEGTKVLPTLSHSTTTLLTFSCLAALLSVLCITLGIHIFKTLRKEGDALRLGSDVWELVSNVEKRRASEGRVRAEGEGGLGGSLASMSTSRSESREGEARVGLIEGANTGANPNANSNAETSTNTTAATDIAFAEKQNEDLETQASSQPLILPTILISNPISKPNTDSSTETEPDSDSDTDNDTEKFVDAESGPYASTYVYNESVYSTPLASIFALPALNASIENSISGPAGFESVEKEEKEKGFGFTRADSDSEFDEKASIFNSPIVNSISLSRAQNGVPGLVYEYESGVLPPVYSESESEKAGYEGLGDEDDVEMREAVRATPKRSQLVMVRARQDLPAWSVRASEVKSLALSSAPSSPSRSSSPSPSTFTQSTSTALTNPVSDTQLPRNRTRARPFTSIPELDVALAMQLRPGMGVGAGVDAAWLVRFVMALFGWLWCVGM